MKIIKMVKNIFLDIIIVLLIIAIIFGYLNKKSPVPIFNYYFFTVLTGSMQKTLYPGDNIIVKKVDNYKVGDIVTYKDGNSYVTHRIVKIEGDSIITKGDANENEDPAFSKKNILGKYVYKSKWINLLVKFRLFIILAVIIIFLIGSINDTLKKKVVDDAS